MKYKFEKPINGSIGIEKYKVTIKWRNGVLIADEPLSSGGKDLGPDPFTLLLSSLASCTLATLRMYIDRKEWDIANIGVQVNMYQTKKDEKTITVIDRDIRFLQEVTPEQREKLLEIATACPVSKILQGEVQVRTYAYNNTETEKQIRYTNGPVTVVWKPEFCKHSSRCVTQLPKVFNLQERPWVNMQGATTEQIAAQVNKCPTGALSYFENKI